VEAPTKFVQIIDFETERMEEMRDLVQEADKRAAGSSGGPTHRLVLQDRNTPNRFLVVMEFESYEDAMRNSNDPETTRMAERLAAMCTRPPSFTDCDVREMTELK
jgi:quinol monooxygenase YgiN